nr:hypothetical protein CFP56_32654 [Quercus suber]
MLEEGPVGVLWEGGSVCTAREVGLIHRSKDGMGESSGIDHGVGGGMLGLGDGHRVGEGMAGMQRRENNVQSFEKLRQLYLTDLATGESFLLCTGEHPILQMALHDDSIWAATSDSSVHRWPAEGRNPQKIVQRGGSFLAGNLSFSRARVSLEGSALVPV